MQCSKCVKISIFHICKWNAKQLIKKMVKTKSMVKFGVRRGIREEDEFEDEINNWWYSLKMVSGYMIFTFDYSFSYLYLILNKQQIYSISLITKPKSQDLATYLAIYVSNQLQKKSKDQSWSYLKVHDMFWKTLLKMNLKILWTMEMLLEWIL